MVHFKTFKNEREERNGDSTFFTAIPYGFISTRYFVAVIAFLLFCITFLVSWNILLLTAFLFNSLFHIQQAFRESSRESFIEILVKVTCTVTDIISLFYFISKQNPELFMTEMPTYFKKDS